MKVKSKRILELVLLISIGFMVGIYFSGKGAKPVVIFSNENDTNKSGQIIKASYDSENLASVISLNNAFVNISEKVSPAVVTITTTKVIKTQNPMFEDEFFRRFFGLPEGGLKRESTALGSGVIVNEKGYILTNNHVVENGEEIKVKLSDNKEYEAEIIGTDPQTDVAVIKIDAKDLPYAILGSSEELRVGEWVAAIGSPLREDLAHTITAGIVSAKGRNLDLGNVIGSFIQTDAAINPGNSGGALVNIRGELIGINTAIATSGGRAGNIGIGFAIPIDLAKKVMQDLIEEGKVRRAWIGVTLNEIDDATRKAIEMDKVSGALISSIVKNSPAEKSGLEIGDVILKVDDAEVKDVRHLQYIIARKNIGEKVELEIFRSGKTKKVKLTLGEMPEDPESMVYGDDNEGEIEDYGIKVSDITPSIVERFDLDEKESGVLVTAASRESKFKAGDIIKRVDNHQVKTVDELKKYINNIEKEYFLVLVKRSGSTFFLTIETQK